MRRYFGNLLRALLNRNPYEAELSEAQSECRKSAKRAADYLNLTENLRKRLTEREMEMSMTAKLYRQRLKECDAKIAELREDLQSTLERLQEAKREIAASLVQ
jgi:predicted  nucleic acid-binding Zn-ribbon protein